MIETAAIELGRPIVSINRKRPLSHVGHLKAVRRLADDELSGRIWHRPPTGSALISLVQAYLRTFSKLTSHIVGKPNGLPDNGRVTSI